MGEIAAQKQLGRLNDPVVFEIEEGPEPGPVGKAVNKDAAETIGPPEKGLKPIVAIGLASVLIFGGFAVLRRLLE